MKPPQKPEADQAVENEEDRDHEIKQPRHDQNQQPSDNGHDRRNVGDGEGHLERLRGAMGWGDFRKISNRETHFILWRGSTIGDAFRFNGFRALGKNAEIAAVRCAIFLERCRAR